MNENYSDEGVGANASRTSLMQVKLIQAHLSTKEHVKMLKLSLNCSGLGVCTTEFQ